MKKTASGGYFLIPAGPANSTSVSSSASADTYGSYVEMIASTAAAIYIVGVIINSTATFTFAQNYCQIMIGTGAAPETAVGEWKIGSESTGASGKRTPTIFPFPIPVATSTRIACKTADADATARAWLITLVCINQADLVDM